VIINAIEQVLDALVFGNGAEKASHDDFNLGDKTKNICGKLSRRWTAKIEIFQSR
jgi:hypothetical protein